MDEIATATDDFSWVMLTFLWTVLAIAVVLGIAWKVQKNRRRTERRAAAREARRKVQAWRKGDPPGP